MVKTDIFDLIEDSQEDLEDLFDLVDSEESLKELNNKVMQTLEKVNSSRKNLDKKQLSKEIRDLIKDEVSKIKDEASKLRPTIIEKIIEKQPIIEQVHIPVSRPPKEIIKEIRVEVQKESVKIDESKFAKSEKINQLIGEIENFKKQLKEWSDSLRQIKETLPFMAMRGGSGVVGLPSQENQGGKFLTTNGGQASWSTITATATSANPLVIGDENTDGSWRFFDDGTDLRVERRESGNWVEKAAFES